MYLRLSRQKRADGSTLAHLQIAENVWDPEKKRSQARIVYNCGRADDTAVTERLKRLAHSILRRCSPEDIVSSQPNWRLLDAWPHGDVHVLEKIWRRLGIDEVVAEVRWASASSTFPSSAPCSPWWPTGPARRPRSRTATNSGSART